jgi:hypothetical protein
MTTGQSQTLIAQEAYHVTGGSARQKCLADQGKGMLHGSVGVLHHDAVVVAQQPSRSGQSHVTSLCLLLHAGDQTAP